jgi:transposase
VVTELLHQPMSRETVRRGLHSLDLSWKKAKKLLGKANTEHRQTHLDAMTALKNEIEGTDTVLVYCDEAHVHQDCDLGYGWSERGKRLYVASSSPGLSAKVSFYGFYVASEPQVHVWPYPRANSLHTVDALERLRACFPERRILLVWDGAPYHRSNATRQAADRLAIELIRLPAYSPDLMPVEALWRWLREKVTYNHCHRTAGQLIARVAEFVRTIHKDLSALVNRLHIKEQLDLEEEKLRFS